MKMINVEVMDVTPGATHQGTIYDQWVTARLPNGVELELFDSAVKVASESDVGEVHHVLLLAQAKKDDAVEDALAGISQIDGEIKLVGEITEIEVVDNSHFSGYDDLVRMEVCDGDVLVIPTEGTASLINQGEIQAGDYLCVIPYRIDLVDVGGR